MRTHYQRRWDELWTIVAECINHRPEPPPLITVYSLEARTECLDVSGQPIVVYDQYLGQVIAQLNRHLEASASPEQVDRYIAKLLAQFSFASGQRQDALRFSLVAYGLATRLERLPSYPAAHETTKMGEVFVLAHEISHLVWRASTAEANHPHRDVRGLVLDVVEEARQSQRRSRHGDHGSTFAESYLTDVGRAWERRHGPIQGDEKANTARRQALELLQKATDAPSRPVTRELREEQFCDLLAFALTLQWCRRHGRIGDYGRVLAACLDTLQELRVLAALRHEVARRALGEPVVGENVSLLDAVDRGSVLRRGAAILQELLDDSSTARQALHERAVATNVRFAQVIGDQLLFFLPRVVSRAMSSEVNRLLAEIDPTVVLESILLSRNHSEAAETSFHHDETL